MSSITCASSSSKSLYRRSMQQRVGVAVGVLSVLLALGELIGWPFLKTPLAHGIERVSGLPIQFDGRFHLRLIVAPQISTERLMVGSGGSVDVPYLLQAEGLVLRWRWGDAWRARRGDALRLKLLEADHLDAHVVRLDDGRVSWSSIRADSARAEAAGGAGLPRIERLVIRSGDIVYRDQPLAIDMRVRIAQLSEPAAAVPWRAEIDGRYRDAPVELLAQAGADVPLLLEGDGDAPLAPLRLSGRVGHTELDFDGVTGALWAGAGMRGNLDLRGPSLRTSGRPLGLTLPDTPPYRLRGRISREGAVWSLVTDDATVGSSALVAAMQFDSATEPPTLSGRLGGRRLAFADLAPVIGADQAPRGSGRVLPDERFDLPSLALMNANVLVDLAQLDFGTPKLGPITDLRVHVSLHDSRLQLSDLGARVAGGRLTGEALLQADRQVPRWEVALRLADVDLQRWIRALSKEAAPGSGDAASYLSGALNARVSLTGAGNSVAEILGHADGRLDLELVDGQISQLVTEALGLDAAQALGMLIAGDQPLRVNCARAEAVIKDGLVKTRHAMLDNDDSTLHLQGGANLRSEALRLRVVAEPKDFSPLSLRAPLNVTGSFQSPQIRIEAGSLLARTAGALALAVLAPPAALMAFIDTGAEPEIPPCAPVQKARPSTP